MIVPIVALETSKAEPVDSMSIVDCFLLICLPVIINLRIYPKLNFVSFFIMIEDKLIDRELEEIA